MTIYRILALAAIVAAPAGAQDLLLVSTGRLIGCAGTAVTLTPTGGSPTCLVDLDGDGHRDDPLPPAFGPARSLGTFETAQGCVSDGTFPDTFEGAYRVAFTSSLGALEATACVWVDGHAPVYELAIVLRDASRVFMDGFESGDLSAWSVVGGG